MDRPPGFLDAGMRLTSNDGPMQVCVYSAKRYDVESFERLNAATGERHELHFVATRLEEGTTALAEGHEAVCAFVNDDLGADVIDALADKGVRFLALRCAGYNHVDLTTAAARA